MTGPLIALGVALFVLVVILAVRAQNRRVPVAAPSAAAAVCVQCGDGLGSREGSRIRGELYCSNDCARWAW